MRNIRWGGATALAAVLMVGATAAADRSIHEIQITASRYAFQPVTIQVSFGEPVPTAGLGLDDRDQLVATVRAEVERLLTS